MEVERLSIEDVPGIAHPVLRPTLSVPDAAIVRGLRRLLKRHPVMLLEFAGPGRFPACAYTIGRYRQSLPDLLVVNLPFDEALAVLDHALRLEVQSGDDLDCGNEPVRVFATNALARSRVHRAVYGGDWGDVHLLAHRRSGAFPHARNRFEMSDQDGQGMFVHIAKAFEQQSDPVGTS